MKKFETSFLLGAATAAHQVEGNTRIVIAGQWSRWSTLLMWNHH